MSATRILCNKSSRVAQEWADNGHLLFGHRGVTENMSWMAGVASRQDRQDEIDLARGVCPRCFCVRPVAGPCC